MFKVFETLYTVWIPARRLEPATTSSFSRRVIDMNYEHWSCHAYLARANSTARIDLHRIATTTATRRVVTSRLGELFSKSARTGSYDLSKPLRRLGPRPRLVQGYGHASKSSLQDSLREDRTPRRNRQALTSALTACARSPSLATHWLQLKDCTWIWGDITDHLNEVGHWSRFTFKVS